MKIRHILFIVTLFTVVSAACNLPFTVRAANTPTVSPSITQLIKTTLPIPTSTPTVTPTPTLTSPIVLVPSPTVSSTPFPTSGIGSSEPTSKPTSMIPITGSATQTATNLITFAPTADPKKIFVGSCGTNQTTITVVINQPAIVGTVLLFNRLDLLPDGSAGSFGAGTAMKAIAGGEYQETIPAPSATPAKKDFNTVLDYKFVIIDITGKVAASSFVYNDIAVTVCKK